MATISETADSPNRTSKTEIVAKIGSYLSTPNPHALSNLCRLASGASGGFSAEHLDQDARSYPKNGLELLIALTGIPYLAKRLTRIAICVTGPPTTAWDPLPSSSLATRAVFLGWQAQLTVHWISGDRDRARLQAMSTLALSQIFTNLAAAKVKPEFAISHDRGWESKHPAKNHAMENQNCDVAISALLAAWNATSFSLNSLAIRGDAGNIPLELSSPLLSGGDTAYGSLKTLDIDLNQRYTVRPPEKVLALLKAARNLNALSFRWNLRMRSPVHDVLDSLKMAITRQHRLKEISFMGLQGCEADFVTLFARIRATLTKARLTRVVIKGCWIAVGGGGWDGVARHLVEKHEVRELVLTELRGEVVKGKGLVWRVGGDVAFEAEGREEVKSCLEKVAEGKFVAVGGRGVR